MERRIDSEKNRGIFCVYCSLRVSGRVEHGKASRRSAGLTIKRIRRNSRRLMLQLRLVQEPFDKHREESDDAHCQIHGDARNHPRAIVSYGLQSLSNDFLRGDDETLRSGMLLRG